METGAEGELGIGGGVRVDAFSLIIGVEADRFAVEADREGPSLRATSATLSINFLY